MSEPLVALARFLPRTRAEGPGERSAIWVQGCSIRCPGCFNPHLWSFRGGTPVPPDELVRRVLAAGTDGVTLLGGEPFDHAPALARVAAGVRAAGRSVMTFSGYTLAELRGLVAAGRAGAADLLGETDLLVAGPFREDRIDTTRPWVGSTNQEFVRLTGRIPADFAAAPDRVEVAVDADGRVEVNGWAGQEALDELLDGLTGPGLSGPGRRSAPRRRR